MSGAESAHSEPRSTCFPTYSGLQDVVLKVGVCRSRHVRNDRRETCRACTSHTQPVKGGQCPSSTRRDKQNSNVRIVAAPVSRECIPQAVAWMTCHCMEPVIDIKRDPGETDGRYLPLLHDRIHYTVIILNHDHGRKHGRCISTALSRRFQC